jgi:hypothetical protein
LLLFSGCIPAGHVYYRVSTMLFMLVLFILKNKTDGICPLGECAL